MISTSLFVFLKLSELGIANQISWWWLALAVFLDEAVQSTITPTPAEGKLT